LAYQPSSNTTGTSTLTHLATVFYQREALDSLRTKFMFWMGVDPKQIGQRNGKTIQFFRWGQFGANTTPKAEGQVGTGLELTTTTVSATVAQYADFLSFSDMLVDTAINDMVAGGVRELGYRAGLTVDNLIKAEIDTAASSVDVTPNQTYYTRSDNAKIFSLLSGINVRPITSDGYFTALAHPYVVYDFLNDPSAGGFTDIVKHDASSTGNSRLTTREDRGFVAATAGVKLYESTNVTQVSGSPNKWRTYFFGSGGVAAIDLAGRGPSRVKDPMNEQFRINVIRPGLSAADPEGVIRAYASYNFVFVTKILDTNPYRFRKMDHPSSIVA